MSICSKKTIENNYYVPSHYMYNNQNTKLQLRSADNYKQSSSFDCKQPRFAGDNSSIIVFGVIVKNASGD
jgi:hypothetical protein